MGIRHLQTFMEKNVPNGFQTVSILEEVENWKKCVNIVIK